MTAIFEAKHVGAWRKDNEVVDLYYPQLQHCMAVTGAEKAYLSVFFGNNKWSMFQISANKEYQAELIAREAEFWGHVERGERPGEEIEDKSVRVPLVEWDVDKMREVDMTGSNAWAVSAIDYVETAPSAKRHEIAKKALKELVEPDVRLAHGHKVEITRSKNGSLRFGEMK